MNVYFCCRSCTQFFSFFFKSLLEVWCPKLRREIPPFTFLPFYLFLFFFSVKCFLVSAEKGSFYFVYLIKFYNNFVFCLRNSQGQFSSGIYSNSDITRIRRIRFYLGYSVDIKYSLINSFYKRIWIQIVHYQFRIRFVYTPIRRLKIQLVQWGFILSKSCNTHCTNYKVANFLIYSWKDNNYIWSNFPYALLASLGWSPIDVGTV